ncbi:hypothetical protein LJC57_02540 [Parabacteroides sp. OttesenSCG-928-G07]|nr:hypothetical protein [Parabacteroides sp. OttesenSCG-928-G21]MDL2277448.1 hypothetical protein [Parabacteroides sp. OttesenSCG-928-G07]
MTGESNPFWFPGRWLGGLSLILSPVLMLTGILLRINYNYFFPEQLKAFDENPLLITTAYSLFVTGNILLWPAVITIARLIGLQKPVWGITGGAMVMFGLFARTFHGGVDHLAFQLVNIHGVDAAVETIAESYGAYYTVSIFTPLILFGWIVLAIGGYISKTLTLPGSIGLAFMSALMLGVLKGSSVMSVIAVSGLCVAFIPLGVRVLKEGPKPTLKQICFWSILTLISLFLLFLLGQAG